MEEHAVPQDITGFKFKLVGDMTIKQFGELAFGAVCAYIIYASGLYPIFKWPLVAFFASFGVALAFLPISERPLDVWLINFFKAIYRPTYYVWKKDVAARVVSENDFMPGYITTTAPEATRGQLQAAPVPPAWPFSPEKKEPVTTTPQEPTMKGEEKLAETPSPTTNPSQETAGKVLSVEDLMKQRQSATPPPIVNTTKGENQTSEPKITATTPLENKNNGSATPFTVDQLVALRQQKQVNNEQTTTQALSDGEKQIAEQANIVKELMIQIDELKNKIALGQAVNQDESAKQLTELLGKKMQASEKLSALRKQVSDTRVSAVAVPEYKEPIKSPAKVRVVEKTVPQQPATIRLTDLPNVINGLVTDSANKPLEGVILVIKDQAGNSIRAFRTNKIGQFIVSTPMQNGTYILELEKNGFNFDTLEVTLSGQILAPLTIKANETVVASQPVIQP